MTKSITIIIIFISTLASGQVKKEVAYQNINGLTILNSISWKDIVGNFYVSDGYCGETFQLDSNMTFRKTNFSCMSNFTVDSGLWTINNLSTISLKSKKVKVYFDIVKFDDFYFLVMPKQRQEFTKDLQAARSYYKNAKPFTIANKTYTSDYLVRQRLARKYYVKET